MRVRASLCGIVGAAAILGSAVAANLPVAAAGAPANVSLSGVAAKIAKGRLTVTGQGTFTAPIEVGGASPATVYSSGKANPAPMGAGFRSEVISANFTQQTLDYTLNISDESPAGYLPVVGYRWPIVVDGYSDLTYVVTAVPNDLSKLPAVAAFFELDTCSVTTTGTACSNTGAKVTGSFGAGGVVSWSVPMSALLTKDRAPLLKPGSQITSVYTSSTPFGISADLRIPIPATPARGGNPGVLTFWNNKTDAGAYTMPVASVRFGFARSAVNPSRIALINRARLNPDGGFAATVAAPTAKGTYNLVVEACYDGPAVTFGKGNCTLQTIAFRI